MKTKKKTKEALKRVFRVIIDLDLHAKDEAEAIELVMTHLSVFRAKNSKVFQDWNYHSLYQDDRFCYPLPRERKRTDEPKRDLNEPPKDDGGGSRDEEKTS